MMDIKKTQRTLFLIIVSINSFSHANLGDWMQNTGVRGMYYAREFSEKGIQFFGSDNPTLKIVFVAALSCFLLKAAYVQKLIKDAPTKKERKKIKKKYYISSKRNTNSLGLLAYTPTVGSGIDYSRAATWGEKMAQRVAEHHSKSGIFFSSGDTASFSQDEQKVIHSIVSQMGFDSTVLIEKRAQNGGTAWGTSNGGMIHLGEEVCNDPEELKFVLGHEVAHLKRNHPKKRALAGFLLPIGVEIGCKLFQYGAAKLIQKLRCDYAIKKKSNADRALYCVKYYIDAFADSYILKSIFSFCLFHVYVRRHEKEADLESVKALKCAKGAIQHFEKIAQGNLERTPMSQENDKQGNYLGDLDHPSLTERVAYLQPIAQEQAKVA